MSEREIRESLQLEYVSGSRVFRAAPGSESAELPARLMTIAFEEDLNTAAFNAFYAVKSLLTSVVRDRLPMDTGKLRAEFEKSIVFKSVQSFGGTPLGFTSIPGTTEDIFFAIIVDIAKLISHVPYAIYHIEELTLKDTYKDPNVKGTAPIDLTIIRDIVETQSQRLIPLMMVRLGWDVVGGS